MMIAWFLGAATALKVTVIAAAVGVGSLAIAVPLAVSAAQPPRVATGGDSHVSDPNPTSPATKATGSPALSTTVSPAPEPSVIPPLPSTEPVAPAPVPELPSPAPVPNPPDVPVVPSVPGGFRLGAASGNWAEVSWTEPLSSGTQPLTGYALFASVDGGTRWSLAGTVSPGQLTFRYVALQQNTDYVFAARAVSNAGSSDYSNSVRLTTTYFAPDAPRGLAIRDQSCSSSGCGGAVTFVPPSNPGSAALSYDVGYSVDGGATWQFVTATPDVAAQGYYQFSTPVLTTNQQQGLIVAVRASNENGSSPLSTAVSFQ